MTRRKYSFAQVACPHCGYEAAYDPRAPDQELSITHGHGVISGHYWRRQRCLACEKAYYTGVPETALWDRSTPELYYDTYYAPALVQPKQTGTQRKHAKWSNDPKFSLAFSIPYEMYQKQLNERAGATGARRARLYGTAESMPYYDPWAKPVVAVPTIPIEVWDTLTNLHPEGYVPRTKPEPAPPKPESEDEDLDTFFDAIEAKMDSIVPPEPAPAKPAEPELSEDDLFVLYLLHPELKEEDDVVS